MSEVLNKVIVLALNAYWQPINHYAVKQAIKSMLSGNNGQPPLLALDIDYELDADGNPTDQMTKTIAVAWDEWISLPVRPYDLFIQTAKQHIRVPTIVIAQNYAGMPDYLPRPNAKTVFERDRGVCFMAGTMVNTLKGAIEIERISEGDLVVSANGTSARVLRCMKRKYSGSIIHVKCVGGLGFSVTPEHPCLAVTGLPLNYYGRPDRKKISNSHLGYATASSLTLADCLISPRPLLEFTNNALDSQMESDYQIIDDKIVTYHRYVVSRFVDADKDFGFFVGLYLAEGTFSRGRLSFSLHQNEKDLENFIQKVALRFNAYVKRKTKDGNLGVLFRVYGTRLASLMKRLAPGDVYTKRVGEEAFKLNKHFLLGMVQGWAAGDGTTPRTANRRSVATVSKHLASDMLLVCNALNVWPSLHYSDTRHDGIRSPAYILNFCGRDNDMILEKPTLSKESNKRTLIKFHTFTGLVQRVKSLEATEVDNVLVYNLQVSGTKTYTANGLAVHNCQYTGEQVGKVHGNLDHVVPRDRGGKDTFENLVWCKKDLNHQKGNRLNDEVGLRLIRKPVAPKKIPRCMTLREVRHPSWKHFLVARQ